MSLSAARGLVLGAGVNRLPLDITRAADGTMTVLLGEPFNAAISLSRRNGAMRYLICAPTTTTIERQPR